MNHLEPYPASQEAIVTQQERFDRIRLLRSPRVGPVTYRHMLARFGTASAALAALPDLLGQRGGLAWHPVSESQVMGEIDAVARLGARYLFHDSPDYPTLLEQTDGSAPILIARGDTALALKNPVAIVGARNASAAAMRLAFTIARQLAERGHTVVSGMARGIDTAAHRGALDAPGRTMSNGLDGAGTIAVIACGIDIVYPPENAALQEKVANEGLLLSELPPGTGPVARQFPARNRIIAGLALGTLVVEAAPGSGSLITARLAAEYGREIMAIPGSPLDPRSRGCNALIRDGAVLVEDADHIVEILTGFGGGTRLRLPLRLPAVTDSMGPVGKIDAGQPPPQFSAMFDHDVAAALKQLLSSVPVAIDDLVRQSGSLAADVQMALVEMELSGHVQRHIGGKVSLMS